MLNYTIGHHPRAPLLLGRVAGCQWGPASRPRGRGSPVGPWSNCRGCTCRIPMRRTKPCRTSDQPQATLRPRFRHARRVCRRILDQFDRRRSLSALRALQAFDNGYQGRFPAMHRGEVAAGRGGSAEQISPWTEQTIPDQPFCKVLGVIVLGRRRRLSKTVSAKAGGSACVRSTEKNHCRRNDEG
jgi:hypothetical protein